MNIISKLERKFGRYAIRDLSKYIVSCFVISYALCFLFEDVYYLLMFSPYHIFVKHQIWRVFTWIFTIPEAFNIFTLIMMFFYLSIGTSIERSIGSFLYNLYIFSGLFFTGVGSLCVSAYQYFSNKNLIDALGTLSKSDSTEEIIKKVDLVANHSTLLDLEHARNFILDTYVNGSYMTHYLLIGIFLGFALIYSDAMVLLYFVIPFKVSWLAYFDLGLMIFEFISSKNAYVRVSIVGYLLAFGIMYYEVKRNKRRSFGYANTTTSRMQRKRRDDRRDDSVRGQVIQMPTNITKHKCAICGRSERDGDELEFRFCSKCEGNYEYCNEHLYTHEHVKKN